MLRVREPVPWPEDRCHDGRNRDRRKDDHHRLTPLPRRREICNHDRTQDLSRGTEAAAHRDESQRPAGMGNRHANGKDDGREARGRGEHHATRNGR